MEESGLYTLRRPRQFKGRADSRPRPVSMPVEAVTMLDLPDVGSMSRVAEDVVTEAAHTAEDTDMVGGAWACRVLTSHTSKPYRIDRGWT